MIITADKMIFITGASRSGTTLLSFVLRNHSDVAGLKELHYFGDHWDPRQPAPELTEQQMVAAAASIFARQAQGILVAKPAKQELAEARNLVAQLKAGQRNAADLFTAAVKRLSGNAGKTIPCEQTPRNIFYAEALLRTYPEARVVHMLRDPRAVMASQKRRWRRRQLAHDRSAFPRSHSLRVWVNYHPYTVARLWMQSTREARRLRDHPRFTLLRFEDLLDAPEQTIRALCARLELAFEPTMLDIAQINSSHQSSAGGARRGFHKEALGTWRTTLSRGEAAIAERRCGPLMTQHGYALEGRTGSGSSGELPYRLSWLLHALGVLIVNPRRAWVQLQAALRKSTAQQEASGDASASTVR